MAEDLFGEEPPESLEEEELNEEDDAIRTVASSMVESWGYERETEQLKVFYRNGHEGSYTCTPTQWEEAKQAPSPGRWMHQTLL